MKLLIVCLGGPSELLFTTPVLRCLKQQLNAEIHFLLLSQYKNVLEANPYIDHFDIIQDGSTGINQLSAQNFDHIIDLQGDSISLKIDKAINKHILRYKNNGFLRFLQKKEHTVQQFFKAIAPLGIRNDGAGLDYFIPKKEELKETDIPASHHYGFVAITINTFHFASPVPAVKVQEICKAIDHPVILLGNSKEYSKAEAIASFDPIKVYNACGKFSFHESADLVRRSKLVIVQDNEYLQVAAALKKPVIAIWGRTSPSSERGPYFGSRKDLYDEVKIGNFKKMATGEIVQLVNKRLAAAPIKTKV